PAPGFLEVDPVLEHLARQPLRVILLAVGLHGRGGAGPGAGKAIRALSPVDDDPVLPSGQRLFRAYADAGLASDTARARPMHLGLHEDALGVVAPDTAKGAALEENRAPDPRPVLGGHALDPE